MAFGRVGGDCSKIRMNEFVVFALRTAERGEAAALEYGLGIAGSIMSGLLCFYCCIIHHVIHTIFHIHAHTNFTLLPPVVSSNLPVLAYLHSTLVHHSPPSRYHSFHLSH